MGHFEAWSGFMKKNAVRFFSYVLVAVLASVMTMALEGRMATGGKLEQLAALIEDKFIGGADRTELEDAAAKAMVSATGDRWSYYIPASEYGTYTEQMNNAYVGVGITIQADPESKGFVIVSVTPDSGAEAAGIQAGDLLVEAAGQDVREMTSSDVRDLVRGEPGTTVLLGVLRNGEKLTVEAERRQIQTKVAQGQMLNSTVGYVAIENFDARCASETIAAIEDLLEQGAEKLIFDVRGNPGGYADELVKVLDYLLPEGEVFHTLRYDGQEHVDYSDESHLALPMAVLVNGDSYSAAEFFAKALQEYEAAIVVGEKTVGKGYFQNTFRLADGSAVALSIGKYFTPSGENLAGVGITPDVECPVDEETYAKIYYETLPLSEDPQVEAALKALGE